MKEESRRGDYSLQGGQEAWGDLERTHNATYTIKKELIALYANVKYKNKKMYKECLYIMPVSV